MTNEMLSEIAELSYINGEEELLKQAILFLKEHKKLSTSFLMRKLHISYAKASFLMKRIEGQEF
jgi:DNA segregation ATPase FtsK/SpoIIIE-like protein